MEFSKVQPTALTPACLISYNHNEDLLPLILANCQYTFEMGKGTKIEYDFHGIERQLMDRFLFSKSRIDIDRCLQIELMVYRTEITNAAVFKTLEEKIPQETLSAAVKEYICNELRDLPEVCRSLDNLDIAISFLKTTGGSQESGLYQFMNITLQMEHSMASQKARQVCEYKHAKALWLLLSVQKSRLMVDHFQENSQEVFESLLEQYHENITDDMIDTFLEYMKNLSPEKHAELLEALHEFLLLQVAIQENRDDEDFVDTTNHGLGEYLFTYIEGMDHPILDVTILQNFPEGIQYKHGASVWILAYKALKKKFSQRYRRH